MLRTFLKIVGPIALLAVPLQGQQDANRATARVRVLVLDSASRRPVVRAGIQTPPRVGVAWTDSAGRFSFSNAPLEFELRIRCPTTRRMVGPLTHRQPVALRADADTQLTIHIVAARCHEPRIGGLRGVFYGHYTSGFESSDFRPCFGLPGLTYYHPAEPNATAWVEFSAGFRDTLGWPAFPDSVSYPVVFVRWRGMLTGPGSYGHMGVATHQFTVDSILEIRHASPSDCALPPPIPLATLYRELDSKVADFAQRLDSMEVELRRDSGTVRTDSIFRDRRASLKGLVAPTARTFHDSAFEIAVYPGGARSQQLYRSQGRSWAFPDSSERGRADSIVRFLDSRGLWISRGEGGVYIELSEQELFRRAAPFVTEPTRELLAFRAESYARPAAADASLMIPWDEFTRRLAAYEAWVVRNPRSPDREEVAQWYRSFLRVFLRGMDNTRLFEYRTGVMAPEMRRTYRRYVAAHPSTASGKLVAEYLRALEASNWRQSQSVRDFFAKHDDLFGLHAR